MQSCIVKHAPQAVVEFVDQTMPLVTQMSLELLCKSRYSRRYCLVVKDPALAGRALAELKSCARRRATTYRSRNGQKLLVQLSGTTR